MVIAQLHGTLDMERGGEVARNLSHFYASVRTGLCAAQAQQSARQIERQISQLVTLYEAWLEVEKATNPTSASPANELANNSNQALLPAIFATDWNA
jgi:flagellin-specific chaperone FliS